MTTKKKLLLAPSAFKRKKPDPIEELRAEVDAGLKHLGELVATRLSPFALEEARREVGAELEKLNKRITEAIDMKPLAYLDSQRVATLHQRLSQMQDTKDVDQAEVQNHKSRIRTLEARQIVEAKNLASFISLGFWGRLKWLVFGPKQLLSTWPPEEKHSFDDIFKGGASA